MLRVNPRQFYTSSYRSVSTLFPFNFSFQPGGSLSPETKFNLILVFRGLVQFQAHMQYLVTKPCLHLKGGHLSGPSFPHLMHVYYCLNLASTIIHKASQRVTSALPIPTSSESVLFRADCPQTCYVVEEGLKFLPASTSQGLRSQACATSLVLCGARDSTQNLMCVRQMF